MRAHVEVLYSYPSYSLVNTSTLNFSRIHSLHAHACMSFRDPTIRATLVHVTRTFLRARVLYELARRPASYVRAYARDTVLVQQSAVGTLPTRRATFINYIHKSMDVYV